VSWFWTTTTDGRIRVLAAGFGLGPRVAAETLLDALGLERGPWRPAATLGVPAPTNVVFNFGVQAPHGADAFAARRVWVDCLMWLRKRLPTAILHYDLALAEAFFETRAELRIAGPVVADVQPLIPPLPCPPRKRPYAPQMILASFGGIETPFTGDAHRHGLPMLILRCLAHAAVQRTSLPHIICCAPAGVVARFRYLPELQLVDWRSPTRLEFVELLKQADHYVVQPGLYGPFEAFEASIPTTLTFPMSYTQFCQTLAFEARGLVVDVPLFAHQRAAVGPLSFDIDEEEPRCFERIAEWFETARDAADIHDELRGWARAALAGDGTDASSDAVRAHYARDCRALPNATDLPLVLEWTR
jgi:hypothetical protein